MATLVKYIQKSIFLELKSEQLLLLYIMPISSLILICNANATDSVDTSRITSMNPSTTQVRLGVLEDEPIDKSLNKLPPISWTCLKEYILILCQEASPEAFFIPNSRRSPTDGSALPGWAVPVGPGNRKGKAPACLHFRVTLRAIKKKAYSKCANNLAPWVGT